MKKKKKPNDTNNSLAHELTKQFTRQTGMLLEQIRSEGRVVAEGHGQLTRQMEELKEDVSQLKENMEHRFIQVEAKIQGLKTELYEFKTEMQEFKTETNQHFNRLENTFGSVLQGHEKRITKVEEKLAV